MLSRRQVLVCGIAGLSAAWELRRRGVRDVVVLELEDVYGGTARGGPRALRSTSMPLHDWSTRPRILITNDDGVESRGLLALKQALEQIGDTTVVAPDTNQSAVGHSTCCRHSVGARSTRGTAGTTPGHVQTTTRPGIDPRRRSSGRDVSSP